MNSAKEPEPRERRRDKAERLRYAIRKANDRMFAVLQTPESRQAPPERHH